MGRDHKQLVTCARCGLICKGDRGPIIALVQHNQQVHLVEPKVTYWEHEHASQVTWPNDKFGSGVYGKD